LDKKQIETKLIW